MSTEPESTGAARRAVARHAPAPRPHLGADPRDIELQRRSSRTSVEALRDRVTELTDWRRQVREHRRELIIGAAIAGFAVGGLMRSPLPPLACLLAPSSSASSPPTPSRPGPTWAPITGPISETKSGSEPKIWRHSLDESRARVGSWMCWTTQASGAVALELRGELDQPLERPPAGPHPLDRRDLLARA